MSCPCKRPRTIIGTTSMRYKSFCLGIVLTSLTWAVVLYLYATLNYTPTTSTSPKRIGNRDAGQPLNGRTRAMESKGNGENQESNALNPIGDAEGETRDRRRPRYDQRKRFKKGDDDDDDTNNNLNSKVRWPVAPKPKVPIRKVNVDQIEVHDFVLDELGLVRSPEDQRIREEGFQKYAFNVLISNRLGSHRHIPDVRNPFCRSEVYPKDLPTASIVICFYNEALSALLRTVHSVIDRTPGSILHEIILIDDYSDAVGLADDIQRYMHKNLTAKVSMYRTEMREGLIRARTFGARKATGQVLVFLDSHVEVNVQWLEPLLTRIVAGNGTTVVCPIIDILNADTLAYSASPLVRGGFNWGLHFKWDSIPPNTFVGKRDYVKPILSPTMAGGLFAISRSYFIELGEYDQGMDIWGGENLEISFRIWMCGGRLEILPCSRVGHIFRKHRPYGSPMGQDTMLRNSLRVAHVWMDEYKEFYFKTRPEALNHEYGNITDRVALRARLKCNPFSWYLKHVYPELSPPVNSDEDERDKKSNAKNAPSIDKNKFVWKKMQQKTVKQYQIRLSRTNLCLEAEDATSKGSLLMIKQCRLIKTQAWFETQKHELLLAELLCLDAGEKYPRLAKCHEMGGPQEWKFASKATSALYNLAAGQCLGVRNRDEGEFVVLEICTQTGPTAWDFLEWGQTQPPQLPLANAIESN